MAVRPSVWPAEEMTSRERFLATAGFETPDRLPQWEPLGYTEATLRRWVREGLPEDVHVGRFFHLDRTDAVPVELGPIPPHRVGELPIAGPEALREVAGHYSCHSPARYPLYWDDCKRCWEGRGYPLRIEIDGPVTWLARWLTATADDPRLADEVLEFLVSYVTLTLERAVSEVDVDYVVIREQANPTAASMATYRRLCSFCREHGTGTIILWAEGDVTGMIPELMEAGITGIMPCHAGAGMNVLRVAEEYPALLIVGGLDVRQLAREKRHADREARIKIPAAMERGGWIPCFDEPIPRSVPLRNYEEYRRVARELMAVGQESRAQ